MTRLGEAELFAERLLSIDEVLARIDVVTLEDVTALAAEFLGRTDTLAIVGPA